MTTQVFLTTTGTGSFTIPSNWISAIIETIGGGAGAYKGDGSHYDSGGGGGAYSSSGSISVTPGTVCNYNVGVGGAAATSGNTAGQFGGDTWFATNNSATSITSSGVVSGAKGGQSAAIAPSGGIAASGIGTIKYSGGSCSGGGDANGGGGGAAGPHGAGGNGGTGAGTSNLSGAGGGGNGGGSNASGSTAGNNYLGSGAGAIGSGASGNGGDGLNGGGGGTGAGSGTTSNGGNGGNGIEWVSYGSGGGGGSAGSPTATTGAGGNGGLYGGGGGSSYFHATGGNGAQGIIVITAVTAALEYGPIPVFPSLPEGWPVNVSPVLDTIIGTTKSLREIRVFQRTQPLWDIEILFEELLDQTQNQTPYAPFAGYTEYEQLCQFFLQMYGTANVFAFNCPWDNSRANQLIGTGDGTTQLFTVYRTWGSGALATSAPVGVISAVTTVQINGVTQSPSDYTLFRNQISFATAPGAGLPITMTFSFYYLCRFTEDEQDFEENAKNRWNIKSLKMQSVTWF